MFTIQHQRIARKEVIENILFKIGVRLTPTYESQIKVKGKKQG